MTTPSVPTIALSALALTALALAAATATLHAVRATYQRWQAARTAAVRPALLAVLAGDAAPGTVAGLDVSDRVLARAVGELLSRVRGQARDGLVEALAMRGLVDRTLARARSRSAVRRAAAAESLGRMGAPGTLPALTRLLDDPSPEVVRVTARALGRIGDPAAAPFMLAALESQRGLTPGQVAAALRHMRGDIATRLADAIEHPAAEVRLVAVQALAIVGTASQVERLALALDDPEPVVRAGAAHALGRLGGPRAVEPLMWCLRTYDASLRAAAAAALGRIGAPQAIDALVAAVDDSNVDVARAASYALVGIGPEGRRALDDLAARHPVAAEARAVPLPRVQQRLRAGVTSLALPAGGV